jgi:hypothetical protein
MPRIRYLKLRFANALDSHEIPCFRAAIIERTRRRSSLFHNHSEDDACLYRYPFIQYKRVGGKACIVCLEEATDDIHHLLRERDLTLRIGSRLEPFRIDDVHLNYFNVRTWGRDFHYRIDNWMALNQDNYRQFIDLREAAERRAMLVRILTGNLLAFAKYLNWSVEERIQAQIDEILHYRRAIHKGRQVLVFSALFRCNVSIPPYVGIGKGASLGFGVVRGRREEAGIRDSEVGSRKSEAGRSRSGVGGAELTQD